MHHIHKHDTEYQAQAKLSERIGVSKRTVTNNMNDLQKRQIIERVGNNKSGYWKIQQLMLASSSTFGTTGDTCRTLNLQIQQKDTCDFFFRIV